MVRWYDGAMVRWCDGAMVFAKGCDSLVVAIGREVPCIEGLLCLVKLNSALN